MPTLTPTEHNFILLLRSALKNQTAERGKLTADVDTDAILRLAAEHKLYHMILSAMPADLLPEPQNRRAALFGQITAQVTAASTFLNLWTDRPGPAFIRWWSRASSAGRFILNRSCGQAVTRTCTSPMMNLSRAVNTCKAAA